MLPLWIFPHYPVKDQHLVVYLCVFFFVISNERFVYQTQIDEFEKRLTAVHTRGLENVESPETAEDNQKGGPSEKTVMRTPLPTRGRQKSKRGQTSKPGFCIG